MVNTNYTLYTSAYGTLSVDHMQNGPNELNQTSRGETLTAVIADPGSFADVLSYQEYAGKYTTTETLESGQPYREFIPDSASINTLIVGLEPNTELQNENIRGVWGIVDSVTDNRTNALTNPSIELSLRVLAPFTEYTDIASVQSALEV